MASPGDRSQSHNASRHLRYLADLLARSLPISVRVDDDSRWGGGLSGRVKGVGHLVETDDRSDTGQRIQMTGGDRVERAVPVLRVRAAAELYGDALTSCVGDVQRVTAVPPSGAIDPGSHIHGVDDLLDQPCRAHAFEDDQRTPPSTLDAQLAPHVERRLFS